MIVVQLRGGLGNQLFQYAVGRQISIDNGINFKLDTNAYNDNSFRKYQLSELNIKAEPASFNEINHLLPFYYKRRLISKVVNRYFRDLLIKYYMTSGRIIEEKELFRFDPSILTIKKDMFLVGYWQNEKYFRNIKELIKQDFQLKKVASPYYCEIQKNILSTESVSVHVRRGDFLNIPAYSICTTEYYNKAFDYITDRMDEVVFFVFSDDLPWAIENIKSKKPIIYVGGCCCDCEELLLMSVCKHHIIANSTFSWWGAWLGAEDCIVVTPSLWSTDGRNIYDFIPEKWVKM